MLIYLIVVSISHWQITWQGFLSESNDENMPHASPTPYFAKQIKEQGGKLWYSSPKAFKPNKNARYSCSDSNRKWMADDIPLNKFGLLCTAV